MPDYGTGLFSPDREKVRYVSSGISLPTLLTIIFLILKLTNVIAWSWFWVFSPLIFSVGLVLAFVIIALIVVFIAAIFVAIEENK